MKIISKAMDAAQSAIDEYGTLQVSAPVLIYAKSNDFQFSLRYGTTNYFNNAKTSVQGRAANLEQVFQSFMLQGKGEVDPTVIASYGEALKNYQQQAAQFSLQQNALSTAARLELEAALASAATNTSASASNQAVVQAYRAFATSIYGTNGAPAFPTAEHFNGNLPSAPTNFFGLLTDTNYGRLLGFLPFLALNTNQPTDLNLPNRSALQQAFGDHTTERIFEAITGPGEEGKFANKITLFGLTMVSIDPGWRTRKDWAGEVVVTAELDFRPARQEVIRRVLRNSPDWPSNVLAKIAKDYGYPVDNQAKLEQALGSDEMARTIFEGAKSENTLMQVAAQFETTVPRSLQLKSPNKPISVTLISPISDNDTFDLASSYRKQTEFAMALSFALRYAGAKGEASAFEKFAHSRQSDIVSRTPLTAVNAFSGQGGVLGFQIGPRVRALEDPASRKSGPGNVLERQSFPALVLVGMSPGDIEPRLTSVTNKNHVVEIVVHEPYIALRQMRRWVPMKRSFFSGRDWYRPQDWFHPRLSEGQRLTVVDQLEAARESVAQLGWKASSFGWTNEPRATLFQKLDYYEEQLVGSLDRITLPVERIVPEIQATAPLRLAQITSVEPDAATLKQGTDGTTEFLSQMFVLKGQNLDVLQSASVKALATNVAKVTLVMSSKAAFVLQAEIQNADYPVVFSFDLDTNKAPAGKILSPAVRVNVASPQLPLPRVDVVSPELVTLARDEQNRVLLQTNRFVLLGVGLKQIDFDKVTIATGRAAHLKTEAIGDGLVVELVVSNASEAITLKLPIRGRNGDVILSRPINVSTQPSKQQSATADKPMPQTLRVEQKTDSGSGGSSIAVTVAADAKADALEAATKVVVSELEKKKPGVLLKDQRVETIEGAEHSSAK